MFPESRKYETLSTMEVSQPCITTLTSSERSNKIKIKYFLQFFNIKLGTSFLRVPEPRIQATRSPSLPLFQSMKKSRSR